MPVTLGTADAVLKEIYEPKMQRQMNDETPLLQVIESSSNGVEQERSAVGGKYVKFPLHIGRNTGIGARREMEDLPLPGNQRYTNAQVNLAYLYGRIQVSGQAEKLAATNLQAYVNVVDEETKRLAEDLSVDLNRQLYSDGTGRLGATNSTGSLTTVTLTTASDVRNFQMDEFLDVYTASAFTANVGGTPTAAKATVTITGFNAAAGTISFSPAVTFAAGDVFTRNGSVAREVLGLQAIVGTQTLYGVNTTTVPTWQSYVDSNGGTLRPMSESLLTLATDTMRVNGGKTNLLIMGLDVKRSYVNLLQQNRQIMNTTSVNGGVSSIGFTTTAGDIRIMDDWTAPPNTIWGLNTKELTLYQASDWEWWERDGGMWRWIQNKDGQDAFMRRYLQLGCHRRNVQFKITDIQGS